jgi:hypothetical protein
LFTFVVSQPDAVSNIAVPIFDAKLAIQMIVNAACANAPHREDIGRETTSAPSSTLTLASRDSDLLSESASGLLQEFFLPKSFQPA